MGLTPLSTCECYEVLTVRTKYRQNTKIERNAGSEPALQEATL